MDAGIVVLSLEDGLVEVGFVDGIDGCDDEDVDDCTEDDPCVVGLLVDDA